jgi:hypothetical protein
MPQQIHLSQAIILVVMFFIQTILQEAWEWLLAS